MKEKKRIAKENQRKKEKEDKKKRKTKREESIINKAPVPAVTMPF